MTPRCHCPQNLLRIGAARRDRIADEPQPSVSIRPQPPGQVDKGIRALPLLLASCKLKCRPAVARGSYRLWGRQKMHRIEIQRLDASLLVPLFDIVARDS